MSLLQRERLFVIPASLLILMILCGAIVTFHAPVPDFKNFESVSEKKAAFFAYLGPFIDASNERIGNDRAALLEIQGKDSLGVFDLITLRRLRLAYSSSGSNSRESTTLIEHIDIVPSALALIQAAKESGWGTSRFARQGYNFFGQQCFSPGCGFTPRNRAPERFHSVQKFQSPEHAVRAYMHNLNTHPRYQAFRDLRAGLRAQDEPLTGVLLASGLESYSERGPAYVSEIQAMIKASQLE